MKERRWKGGGNVVEMVERWWKSGGKMVEMVNSGGKVVERW